MIKQTLLTAFTAVMLLAGLTWAQGYGHAGYGSAGVTDHGDLNGLSDNDHPQYGLLAGDQQWTGTNTFSGNVVVSDDSTNYYGTSKNYWITYDNSQLEVWGTDVDGGGTDGLIWSVDDGTDDVDFNGHIIVQAAGVYGGGSTEINGMAPVHTMADTTTGAVDYKLLVDAGTLSIQNNDGAGPPWATLLTIRTNAANETVMTLPIDNSEIVLGSGGGTEKIKHDTSEVEIFAGSQKWTFGAGTFRGAGIYMRRNGSSTEPTYADSDDTDTGNHMEGDILHGIAGGVNMSQLNGTGLGIGGVTPLSLLHLNTATEDTEFVDAGSTGATEQDWIEVEIGGNVGYIRVYAAK